MKKFFQKFKSSVSTFFFKEEGGKKVIKALRLKYCGAFFLSVAICLQFFRTDDQSHLEKSYRPISNVSEGEGIKNEVSGDKGYVLPTKEEADKLMNAKRSRNYKKSGLSPTEMIFSGKQVIERTGGSGDLTPLPSGTNFIGKLLTGIDTREANQIAKVLLPYGARHASGGYLPKNAVLLGIVSQGGDSEKVYIRFNRIIFPNGKEYKMDAQALNSADYSPGILGAHHSNADVRMASTVALTMVSAATDVLTQRSMVGGVNPYMVGSIQPDATAKNAVLQGVSQVTKQEAQKQTQEMQNAQEYVTVSPDSDLIISLLSPFTGEGL